MKAFKFLILLVILPLFIITCSKDDDKENNGDFVPDLTKNVLYIDDNEHLLTDGFVVYLGTFSENFVFAVFLYSSGISFDTSNFTYEGYFYSLYDGFEGNGDMISMLIMGDTWDSPDTGTYSADFNEGDPGYLEVEGFAEINFEGPDGGYSYEYEFPSATMILQKEGSEYEFTVTGSGAKFGKRDVKIKDIEMAAHYKSSLPEYYFLTEDPSACGFDADTLDFTFGIDYDHPEKYLIPGEQSDLSAENLEIVRSAIGTPSADIDGIMKVCHWINQNFTFDNAGGAMAGVNTVDELFEIRTFYGCHSLALIISSVLREFGFPAVMIETVDIQWGFDYRAGKIDYFSGHVMSEIYINNKWILLDNNCTYVNDYDYTNPYISLMNPQEKGLFVFGKGVDIWDYRGGNESFTDENLLDFSYKIHCYEDLFYTVDYDWD